MVHLFSQWVYNVSQELLQESEEACSGSKSGDRGRLWGFPPALVRDIRDIGEPSLCLGEMVIAKKLQGLFDSISRVRWSLVDPCYVRRPLINLLSAPIFAGGNFVPLDPVL